MKIVFLNVWGSQMQDGLVEYLKELVCDTDVFCFQEATKEMRNRCIDVLSDYIEISDYKFISDNDDFSQSTFINKNIELLSYETLLVKNRECGLALYTKVRIGNNIINICNVHGRALPNDKLDSSGRLAQSKELIDFFEDTIEPVVIGGDFNILPKTQSIEMFEQHSYRDLIKEFEIDTTRNHLVWDRFPVKMYYSDYIFLNNKVKLASFEVVKNEVSDHLPLLLEINF